MILWVIWNIWDIYDIWVGIVLIYLQQITLVTYAILIGVILYPYLSTNIIVWILGFIQVVWNFIFSSVRNCGSA
jgi:hypothetical protein